MSIKITQENYSTYKKVYEIVSSHLFRDVKTLPATDTTPIALLDKWEESSMALARKGLQSGLNDCLSSVSHWPNEMLVGINMELERNRLPNVSALTGLFQKSIRQVLTAGKINTIDLYYIIKEVLDDTTSDITAGERRLLNNCIREYELATSR